MLRAELNAFASAGNPDRFVQSGALWVRPDPDDDPDDPVVWYALSKGHLLELLGAARAGATNSELLLALDAAALDDGEVEC